MDRCFDVLCINPLSALMTYTHMSLCCHPLECCVDIYVYSDSLENLEFKPKLIWF